MNSKKSEVLSSQSANKIKMLTFFTWNRTSHQRPFSESFFFLIFFFLNKINSIDHKNKNESPFLSIHQSHAVHQSPFSERKAFVKSASSSTPPPLFLLSLPRTTTNVTAWEQLKVVIQSNNTPHPLQVTVCY